jgi:hypothetical protein
MLRLVIVALVTLELVLLTAFFSPADAASSNFEHYIWSYASVGSNQLVCKKVVMHPDEGWQSRSSKNQPVKMNTTSTVVSDRFCADSLK